MLCHRWRFSVPALDYRPVEFPPPGPYWCSGYDSGDHATLVAYLPVGIAVTSPKLWPDALCVSCSSEEPHEIHFTSRFPRPDWWTQDAR